MAVFLIFLIITTLHMSSSAPTTNSAHNLSSQDMSRTSRQTHYPFELAMLDKLHQPWAKPVKKAEYPRKGETMCKGEICKVKEVACEDCQYAVPLRF